MAEGKGVESGGRFGSLRVEIETGDDPPENDLGDDMGQEEVEEAEAEAEDLHKDQAHEVSVGHHLLEGNETRNELFTLMQDAYFSVYSSISLAKNPFRVE